MTPVIRVESTDAKLYIWSIGVEIAQESGLVQDANGRFGESPKPICSDRMCLDTSPLGNLGLLAYYC